MKNRGDVGIGTTGPSEKLEVSDGTNGITFAQSTTNHIINTSGTTNTTNTTDFGILALGSSNSTLDNSPAQLVVENQGNIEVNLTINASALWSAVAHNTSYFMAMANISGSESGSFDTSKSVMSWFNLSTEHKEFVAWLNWTDTRDIVAIEINITSPVDEPPGAKRADIVVRGVDN